MQSSKSFIQKKTLALHRLDAIALVRAINEIWTIHAVRKLADVPRSFDWSDFIRLGIENDAWDKVRNHAIEPTRIFPHPRVLAEQPQLLEYYRSLALLSQKELSKVIGGSVAQIEAGKVERPAPELVTRAVVAINSILSAVVTTAADIGTGDLPGFQFAAAGATIQGSWNNAVGKEGERAVGTILLNNLRDEIRQIVWKDGSPSDYKPKKHADLLDRIDEVRVVRLKQGYHLVFASEPDISLRTPKDLPVVAIEVKAGSDPAGALERLGAAMKSFENERNLNPRVKTVYVVRALTPEVQKRISQSKPFDYTFGLSDLLADQKTQRIFSNLILRNVLGK